MIELINNYLQTHQTSYEGKYRFRSGYQSNDNEYRAIYYIMDDNLRSIEIFVEVKVTDKIETHFSEDLNELESQYIINDTLKHLLERKDCINALHFSLYPKFIDENSLSILTLNPEEYINVFGYMKYHKGINSKTIDAFYSIFMPSLKRLIEHGKYHDYLKQVVLLLQNIKYEYVWTAPHANYLDTEYQYHLYYLREIFREIYQHFDEFYQSSDELFSALEVLCENKRFALFVMVAYLKNLLTPSINQDAFYEKFINKGYRLYDVDGDKDQEYNLVYSYIHYIYTRNHRQYVGVVKEILRDVINTAITYVNHDIDLALGEAFLQAEGYQLLVDIFREDYNTFLFTVFPISSFPEDYLESVKKELCDAVVFFSGRMDNENYRLSSLEQVMNINRLLLDNYREWYL